MSRKASFASIAALVGLLSASTLFGGFLWAADSTPQTSKARPRSLTDSLGPARISFIPVTGPPEGRARFLVRGTNKAVYFAPDGLTFGLKNPAQARGERGSELRVRMNFLGVREDLVPEGLESPGAITGIIYRDLWPGIDLVYKSGMDRLDCEFIVHPGADPSLIKVAYRGIEAISLTDEGRLAIRTLAGDFEEDIPVGYQEVGGRRKDVPVTYSLADAAGSQSSDTVSVSGGATGLELEGPAIAVGFDVGPYDRTEALVLDSAGGYFGRKTGTTSIEVTGGHAGGSKFNLPTGQWIARMGILGYMQNSPADGTLAIYKDTAAPDIKQYVCHTVTGPLPVGPANKAWTVLEVAGGPIWLDAGDYWILRNDSGSWANKFVITGEALDSNKWGWCFVDYPAWPPNTQYRTWVEDFSNVEGCLYAEWDGVVPDPLLTSLAPETATAGGPGFLLSVMGSDFVEGAVVTWDGADRQTTWTSSTELSAKIDAADVAVGKIVQIAVRNPGGGISNALEFTIGNPAPVLSSLVPGNARAGGPDLLLTLAGLNFVPNSVVRWNGNDRATTWVSGTELQAAVPAGDLAAAGETQVTVFNPPPAGGLSSPALFAVNNPRPVLGVLSPAKADAGSSAFDLVLAGSSFVPGAAVLWGGTNKAAICVSSVELRASILAADIARGGEIQVTVSNPAPAEGTSNMIVFPISTFAVSPSPTALTVTAGQTATYDLRVAPQFGPFDSPVSFTCKGLPNQCTASFSPDSVTPGAGGASTTLRLSTKAESRPASGSFTGSAGSGLSVVGFSFLVTALMSVIAGRRRPHCRTLRRLAAAWALLGAVLLTGSCGAIGPLSTGTPKGTYHVTVEGTSGTLTVPTAVTLIVK